MRINKREIDLLRASKCMTARELSKKARVSYTAICKDGAEVSVMTLGKIARALDTDPRSIILPEEEQK